MIINFLIYLVVCLNSHVPSSVLQVASNMLVRWPCHVCILRMHNWLMHHWWWGEEYDRRLVVHDCWPVNHNWCSVYHNLGTMNNNVWSMHNQVRSMVDFWWLVVDQRWPKVDNPMLL